ncbi:MAG: hypothetical protein ACFE0Q_07420 [Anaerolineae bacterium]
MRRTLLLCIIGLWLAGCEAQATPIASIATPTGRPQPTSTPVIALRYAVAANLAPYVDLDMLPFVTDVIAGNETLNIYDLVVSYGAYEGWQLSPISHHVTLAINPNLSPFDEPSIRALVADVLDRESLVTAINIPGVTTVPTSDPSSSFTIRAALANAGYPDGFQLILASDLLPAVDTLREQFARANFDLTLTSYSDAIWNDNQAHLIAFNWTQDDTRQLWAERVGEENMIDLWMLPISYLAPDDLALEFTETGLPIPMTQP